MNDAQTEFQNAIATARDALERFNTEPLVESKRFNLDAARLPPTAYPNEREHLVARVDQLFRLPVEVVPFPHLPLAFGEGTHLDVPRR